MSVNGVAALVAGRASGLGEACVRRFIADGGRVVIADLNEARGQALVAELGERSRFTRVDVADEASVRAGLDVFGGVDVAVPACTTMALRPSRS